MILLNFRNGIMETKGPDFSKRLESFHLLKKRRERLKKKLRKETEGEKQN